MSKMTIEEAVRTGLLKEGDFVRLDELYKGKNKVISLSYKETGWTETQNFSQESLEWMYAKDKNGNHSFWGSTSSTKLFLKGETGFVNGVQNINKICYKLYSNLNLGITARGLNVEDVNHFIGKNIDIGIFNDTWLTDQYIDNQSCFIFYGMYTIHRKVIRGNGIYRMDGFNTFDSLGICPVMTIHQTSKISLDV